MATVRLKSKICISLRLFIGCETPVQHFAHDIRCVAFCRGAIRVSLVQRIAIHQVSAWFMNKKSYR